MATRELAGGIFRRWLAVVVCWVLVAVSVLASGVAASHGSPVSMPPAAASSDDWSNAGNVLSDNAQYAGTTTDGATLDVGPFASADRAGPISAVDLVIDQQQPNHEDDELTVVVSASGCGGVTASPDRFEPTGTRQDQVVSLSCSNGWSWARAQGVHVGITTDQVSSSALDLSPLDGEWRVYYVFLRVTYTNQAPAADAGPDQTVTESTTVSLDGTGSSDPEAAGLSYAWTQVGGPTVSLSGASTAGPSFVAPTLSSNTPQVLGFELTATDSEGHSGSDTVQVTVENVNHAPTADAGDDQAVPVGVSVTLDGTDSSDPDGDTLSFAWTQTSGPSVSLDDPATARPTFGAPSSSAQLVFELVVTDSEGASSSPDSVSVSVSASPGPSPSASPSPSVVPSPSPASSPTAPVVEAGPVGDAGGACRAEVVNAGTLGVPVSFGGACPAGVQEVVVTLPGNVPVAYVEVSSLTDPPSGLPVVGPEGVRAYDVRLTDASGGNVQPVAASVAFVVEDSMYDGACPEGGCDVRAYHHSGAAWRALSTDVVDGEGVRVVRAATDGFSPFAVAVVPATSGAGFPWWLLVVAGMVLVGGAGGAAWVLRSRSERSTGAAASEAAAAPTDAAGPPERVTGNLMDELRNEELLQFLNNAAHDLASPLTPIKLQLAILERTGGEALDEGHKKALGVVARNIEHMGMLVGDLKEASRIQAGKFQVFPEPIDLVGVVEDAHASFEEPASAEGITLDVKIEAAALPAMADRGRITQVFYNLVSNALKFTPEGGRVRIEARRRDGEALLMVRDTGLGLSEEDADQLFKPFSQVHGAKEKKKGSGLGLYICKGIVEEHGGRIWVESAGPGTGTAFLFTIPLREQDAASQSNGEGVGSRVARLRAGRDDGGIEG